MFLLEMFAFGSIVGPAETERDLQLQSLKQTETETTFDVSAAPRSSSTCLSFILQPT